jgi:hypothetical protein
MIKKRQVKDEKSFIDNADSGYTIKKEKISEKKKTKLYSFSLEPSISEKINELSYKPRKLRAARSDIVRAGVKLVEKLSENELEKLLLEIKAT